MATSFSVQKNARNEAIALQAKAKALREQQRTRIDGRHKYILGLVADRLDLELSAVEDFMLDGDQLDLFDELFELDGRRAILFYYQEADTPVSGKPINRYL